MNVATIFWISPWWETPNILSSEVLCGKCLSFMLCFGSQQARAVHRVCVYVNFQLNFLCFILFPLSTSTIWRRMKDLIITLCTSFAHISSQGAKMTSHWVPQRSGKKSQKLTFHWGRAGRSGLRKSGSGVGRPSVLWPRTDLSTKAQTSGEAQRPHGRLGSREAIY